MGGGKASSTKQKRGIGSFCWTIRRKEIYLLDSVEDKKEDTSDQNLKKKPENKTIFFTSPLLEEGDKDKKGGGEGEKGEQLGRTQGQGIQGGRTQEQTEAKMGNIFSAPNRVRKKVITICTWLHEC